MFVKASFNWENGSAYFDPSGEFEKLNYTNQYHELYFEIKPVIPSVGELIRQLRMYQSYIDQGSWYVVSPDTRFRTMIEGQNFGFIEAPKS